MKNLFKGLFAILFMTAAILTLTGYDALGFLVGGSGLVNFAMPLPVCSTDCSADMPIVDFDECNPEINGGQIAKLYVTNIGYPLTDWTDAVEWNLRLSNSLVGADKIRTIHVVGSKPAPAGDEKEISLGRKLKGTKTHVVNVKVDETNDINHEMVRQLECGGNFLFWYETLEGKMFGGNEGIKAAFFLDMVIPEASTDIITNDGKIEWKSKFTEERIVSPLA